MTVGLVTGHGNTEIEKPHRTWGLQSRQGARETRILTESDGFVPEGARQYVLFVCLFVCFWGGREGCMIIVSKT